MFVLPKRIAPASAPVASDAKYHGSRLRLSAGATHFSSPAREIRQPSKPALAHARRSKIVWTNKIGALPHFAAHGRLPRHHRPCQNRNREGSSRVATIPGVARRGNASSRVHTENDARRSRQACNRHDPHPFDGCGGKGEVGTPGHADGLGAG